MLQANAQAPTIDTLEELAQSPEAAFAVDRTDRIIFWNEACERLLGRSAREVLGRHCFEVMAGRDVHGNIHCYSYCPIMYQARMACHEPIRDFHLTIRTGGGTAESFKVHTYLLPATRPALATIVHLIDRGTPSSSAVRKVMETYARASDPHPGGAVQATTVEELTQREREVLRCLAEGLPTPSIANALGISPVTVRNHVQKILEKLDVHTKFAAVAYAYQNGLV